MSNRYFYSSSRTYSINKFRDEKGNLITKKIGRAEIDKNGEKKYYLSDGNNQYVEVSPDQYNEATPITYSKPFLENLPIAPSLLFTEDTTPIVPFQPAKQSFSPYIEIEKLRRENRRLKRLLNDY